MMNKMRPEPPPAPAPVLRPGTAQVIRRGEGHTWLPAALLAALGLCAFLFGIYWWVPQELPAWNQRLLALVTALLALLVYILATHQSHRPDPRTLAQRVQQRHHSVGAAPAPPPPPKPHARTIALPLFGDTTLRTVNGAVLFVGVLFWWLTPWAPVRVRAPEWENLAVPLGNEIEAVLLALTDERLAVPHPPVRPQQAITLASAIPATASFYLLGQKATAQGSYEDAQDLLNLALKEEHRQGHPVELALGQNALFAGKLLDAARYYEEVLQDQPRDPGLWCQAAAVALHAGNYTRAEEIIRKGTELCQQHQALPATLAMCLHLQAAVAICRGKDLEKVDQWNREAQGVWGEAMDEAKAYGASLNNQAVYLALLGKYPGAQNNFNFAYGTWKKALGIRHPYLAAARSNLAMIQFLQGRFGDAQRTVAEVQRLQNEGGSASTAARALTTELASRLELALGHDREGLAQARQALERLEESYSPQHPQVIPSLDDVGSFYRQMARYRRAESYYSRLAEVSQRTLPREHPYQAACLAQIGGLHLEEGRLEEARRRTESALKLDEKTLGNDHPAVARDLVQLAQIFLRTDRSQEVRPLLQRALTIQEANLPEQHPAIVVTLATLAALEGPEGATRYQQALAMAQALLGEKHRLVASVRYGLAKCLAGKGKFEEAKEQIQQCIAVRQEVLPPYHPGLADALELYAEILRKGTPGSEGEVESLGKQAEKIRGEHAEINASDARATGGNGDT